MNIVLNLLIAQINIIDNLAEYYSLIMTDI